MTAPPAAPGHAGPGFWLLLLGALWLAGCTDAPEPDTDRLTFYAFGTIVDVTLYPAGVHDLLRIESELGADLEAMHDLWHAWEPGPLVRTNDLLAAGEAFSAPPSILTLVERAQELDALTGGLFNPALGRLVAAWGFHQNEAAGPPPTPATLAALLEDPPRMADIEREGTRLRGRHPELQLDFGGLAKGLAIARSLERLAELGVEHAIVNAGGDLMTMGRPAHRAWRIGIRDPRAAQVLASVELGSGEALFTSGDYERGYEWEGERMHHVIDPRSGRPARGLTSATVLHDDPVLADAAATTLMIAGPDAWPRYARRLGAELALVTLPDGTVELTPAIASRVEFQREVTSRIRTAEAAGAGLTR
ncbi:Thiamin biosynthesis lipoprotein ApbE [Thioalkalivibrio nitratireducens DSM 14787]|uniref:FAD:protein FMN transferase n=1 Tax=Thioalkalivibrio nitratireducens (strain DSM 14787 / UNIQEM 213 / ALEN2) TaxID=1255043 RepID=L0DUJ8_THIND|nr:FAD:protein FMN transferase [Thioalkalivibrio nitratireducens]AGA32021.1 Thiamin biosynthesis lipoprotein ApbE [Thioalkalivibrio nitratireducens DSM 14787]